MDWEFMTTSCTLWRVVGPAGLGPTPFTLGVVMHRSRAWTAETGLGRHDLIFLGVIMSNRMVHHSEDDGKHAGNHRASKQASGISRRRFIQAAGAGLVGAALGTGCPGIYDPPNVLMVIVDQMRMPKWFSGELPLSGYERLRREGLSFANHFAAAVPCSPSRASLLTGLHIDQHGVRSNVGALEMPGFESLNPRHTTLGHLFRDAGYRTPYIGKWHLCSWPQYTFYGLEPYGYEAWEGPDHVGNVREGEAHDATYADQAIEWLRQHGAEGPWFLTCSLINPHDIAYYRRGLKPSGMVPQVTEKLPENFQDSLEGKPRIQSQYQAIWGFLTGTSPEEPIETWLRYLDYYEHLTQEVDVQINRLIEALDRFWLQNNTIVVFVSDHGDMAGSHQLQAKGPFVYHEATHVPLIMRWPGRIPGGVETDALAQTVDILPTLVELAGLGASCDHLPGKSLAPVIRNPQRNEVNDHVLLSFGYVNPTTWFADVPVPQLDAPMQVRAVFEGRYKYARYFEFGRDEEEFELYDVLNDPYEMTNLTGNPDYAKIEAELADRLHEAGQTEMAPLDAEYLRPA